MEQMNESESQSAHKESKNNPGNYCKSIKNSSADIRSFKSRLFDTVKSLKKSLNQMFWISNTFDTMKCYFVVCHIIIVL